MGERMVQEMGSEGKDSFRNDKLSSWSKNVFLMGVVLLLFFTNPTQDAYYQWVKGEIKDKTLVAVPEVMLLGMEKYPKTKITNCKIFSFYETYFDSHDQFIIGIGGSFFTVYSLKL